MDELAGLLRVDRLLAYRRQRLALVLVCLVHLRHPCLLYTSARQRIAETGLGQGREIVRQAQVQLPDQTSG